MPDSHEAPHAIPSVRRAATLPSKLIPRQERPPGAYKASEEVLFYHPSARVVKFAPRAVTPVSASSVPADFDYPVDTIETLPWRSPTERTEALGPLRLVQGLTIFLKCGNVVHAILKNSQCWCVDGESTFVLRIRPLTYYRIELPHASDEEKNRVVELKGTLPRVLRYEITPCPFKRGFRVELPVEATARRRKRAWQPKERTVSAPAGTALIAHGTSSRSSSDSETKERVSGFTSTAEDTDENTIEDDIFTPQTGSANGLDPIADEAGALKGVGDASDVDQNQDNPRTDFTTLRARYESHQASGEDPDASLSSSAESFHSVMPPDLSSFADTSSGNRQQSRKAPVKMTAGGAIVTEIPSRINAQNYFESNKTTSSAPPLQSSTSPTKDHHHSHGLLMVPVDSKSAESAIATQASIADNGSESSSDLSAELRRRRMRPSIRREISPMPPASILYHPDSTRKSLSSSLIQKTCTTVLLPSIQLLMVLVYVAAQFVVGPAVNSAIKELKHRRPSQPGSHHESESEDDFGIPLTTFKTSESFSSSKTDPWDLD